jgi:hypothetical protein
MLDRREAILPSFVTPVTNTGNETKNRQGRAWVGRKDASIMQTQGKFLENGSHGPIFREVGG